MSLFFSYEAFGMLPGINAAVENVVNDICWGPWEHNRAFVIPVLLDGASRDLGSSPTTLLRPGLLMGVVTATKQASPLTIGASDGTQKLYGVLLYDVTTQAGGADADRWFGFLMCGGNVKAKSLIESKSAGVPGTWVGDTNEAAIRALLTPRFILDDQFFQ